MKLIISQTHELSHVKEQYINEIHAKLRPINPAVSDCGRDSKGIAKRYVVDLGLSTCSLVKGGAVEGGRRFTFTTCTFTGNTGQYVSLAVFHLVGDVSFFLQIVVLFGYRRCYSGC